MAEAERGEAEQSHSPRIQSYARDLLRRFSGNFRPEDSRQGASSAATTEEDSGKIELGLGLSIGGCFGAEPTQKRGLVRSSSVACLPFLPRAERDPAASMPVITRTSSLPVEMEEQRKRKELQSLRRMEAKKKRSEKRNSYRSGARDWPAGAAAPAEGYGGGEDMQQDGNGGPVKAEAEHRRACSGGPHGVTAAAWTGRAAARAVEGMKSLAPASQGSVGPQGSSSSGVSDYSFDARLPSRQGSGIVDGTEPGSRSTVLGEPTSYLRTEAEDLSKKKGGSVGGGGLNGMRHMMKEMPCVSTRGGGPDGRRVEGFLYRYRKGEEVRIVCVCHGNFFSPAEFVKHAGGGEVAHPLRHIVVNPSPSSFL